MRCSPERAFAMLLALALAAPGAAASGRSSYVTYCAPCHGERGEGDGPLSPLLEPRPPRHSDAAYMQKLSDDYLLRLLKEGGPAVGRSALMGEWGRTLSDAQLRELIEFIRTLPKRPAR
jgi:cytochrome c553